MNRSAPLRASTFSTMTKATVTTFVAPTAPIILSCASSSPPNQNPSDRKSTDNDNDNGRPSTKHAHTCKHPPPSIPVSRRTLLRKCFLAASAFILRPTAPATSSDMKKPWQQDMPAVCRNCEGGGKVPCELCAGTGFWRAISGNDPNQRYKGVVCPECEGSGSLTCPVCLGTGEGNVKGLLRRRRVEPGPGRILQS